MVLSEEQAIARFVQRHGGLGRGQYGAGSAVATVDYEPEAFTTLYRLTPAKEGDRTVLRNEPVKVRELYAWRQLAARDEKGNPVFSREPWPEKDGSPAPVSATKQLATGSGTKRRRRKRKRGRKRG